jgi:hypothetical protein
VDSCAFFGKKTEIPLRNAVSFDWAEVSLRGQTHKVSLGTVVNARVSNSGTGRGGKSVVSELTVALVGHYGNVLVLLGCE